jgi:toxin YoeB
MSYELRLSKQANKDWTYIQSLGSEHALHMNAEALFIILSQNPWQNPPPFKKLMGPLHGCLARRMNKKHRFVYQVHENARVVFVLAMLGHYNDNG